MRGGPVNAMCMRRSAPRGMRGLLYMTETGQIDLYKSLIFNLRFLRLASKMPLCAASGAAHWLGEMQAMPTILPQCL